MEGEEAGPDMLSARRKRRKEALSERGAARESKDPGDARVSGWV